MNNNNIEQNNLYGEDFPTIRIDFDNLKIGSRLANTIGYGQKKYGNIFGSNEKLLDFLNENDFRQDPDWKSLPNYI